MSLFVGVVKGDFVKLQDGSVLRGEIIESADGKGAVRKDEPRSSNWQGAAANGPGQTVIRLMNGTTTEVERSAIKYAIKRPLKFEEYEERLEQGGNSLEGEWELADWCRRQGMEIERRYHLERVLDFDPQHALAHRALGEVRDGNDWTTLDDKMAGEGFIKYKGRYVKVDEALIEERSLALRGEEKKWIGTIRGLREKLMGPQRGIALEELKRIVEPAAVKGLLISFRDDPNEENRRLLVEILSRIQSSAARKGLVAQGLFDSQQRVSDLAFASIPVGGRSEAIPLLVKGLKHQSNLVVNRAGTGLGMLGATEGTEQLISALVTEHVVPVQRVVTTWSNPAARLANGELPVVEESGAFPALIPVFPTRFTGYGQTSISHVPGGSYALLYGFGGPKWAPLVDRHTLTDYQKEPVRNPLVLAALRELTGKDFGYDKSTWTRWWLSQQPVRRVP